MSCFWAALGTGVRPQQGLMGADSQVEGLHWKGLKAPLRAVWEGSGGQMRVRWPASGQITGEVEGG